MVEELYAAGIEFFIQFPDSFGAPAVAHFEDNPNVRSFPVASGYRFEAWLAIGLIAAGGRPP